MRIRQSRIAWFSTCTIVLVAVGVAAFWCAQSGSGLWHEMGQELSRAEIATVEIRAPGPTRVVVDNAEVQVFVQALASGTFAEENRRNFGPTAEVVVLFTSRDGQVSAANQWPDGRFELVYRGSQFLVEAPDLEQLLRLRGFTPR